MSIGKAEKAVTESIARLAEQDGSEQLDAPALKQLAEGVAAIKHGAQGGVYHNNYTGHSSTKTETDDHRTDHQGEERPRPAPGFGS